MRNFRKELQDIYQKISELSTKLAPACEICSTPTIYAGWSGEKIHFRCQTSRAHPEMKITNRTLSKLFTKQNNIHRRQTDAQNKIWYSFREKFLTGNLFRADGYCLMTAVEKWAKRYPTVTVTRYDDAYFYVVQSNLDSPRNSK